MTSPEWVFLSLTRQHSLVSGSGCHDQLLLLNKVAVVITDYTMNWTMTVWVSYGRATKIQWRQLSRWVYGRLPALVEGVWCGWVYGVLLVYGSLTTKGWRRGSHSIMDKLQQLPIRRQFFIDCLSDCFDVSMGCQIFPG
jgi:hypothetical protein